MIRPSLEACVEGDAGLAPLDEEMMNEAVACMTGFFILRGSSIGCDSTELNGVRADCDSNSCSTLRGAVAWKNSHIGVVTVDQTTNLRMDSVLMSDNHIGTALHFTRSREDNEHRVYMHNVTIFGFHGGVHMRRVHRVPRLR